MLFDYFTELVGAVPQSLRVMEYFLCTLLVVFGLYMVLSMFNSIFHKFF